MSIQVKDLKVGDFVYAYDCRVAKKIKSNADRYENFIVPVRYELASHNRLGYRSLVYQGKYRLWSVTQCERLTYKHIELELQMLEEYAKEDDKYDLYSEPNRIFFKEALEYLARN